MTHTLSPEDTGSRLVVDRSLGETQDLTETAARALAALPGFRLDDADATAEIRFIEPSLLTVPAAVEHAAFQPPTNPDQPRPQLPPVPPPTPSAGDGPPRPVGPGAPPQPQPQPHPGPPPPFAGKVLLRPAVPTTHRSAARRGPWAFLVALVRPYRGSHRSTVR